jgi:hypothetical protein
MCWLDIAAISNIFNIFNHKVGTKCTTLSLIPTVTGNTVRSFPTHGQQSAAKGSSTTVARSDIRSIQHFDLFGSWFGPERAL